MASHNTKRKHSPLKYELAAWNKGSFVLGIDEAGRGCLAGPVVAGAVVFPHKMTFPYIGDSKTMSPQSRAAAYTWIKRHSYYAIGIATAAEIDQTNIILATKQAMMRAFNTVIQQLSQKPERVLIDAVQLPNSNNIPQESHYYGEQISISIAAASIIAKESRDTIMQRYDTYFPGFGFAKHKGYGTKLHHDCIKKKGATILHRLSFAPLKKESKNEQQIPLFW